MMYWRTELSRALSQNLEVVGGQGQTHSEHDDAENDGLSSSAHPVEGMWDEEWEHQVGWCQAYPFGMAKWRIQVAPAAGVVDKQHTCHCDTAKDIK